MKYSPLYLAAGAYICGIFAAAQIRPSLMLSAVFTGLAIFLAFFRTPVLPITFESALESRFGTAWTGLVTRLIQLTRTLRAVALLAAFLGTGALAAFWQLQPPPELETVLGEFAGGVPREILGVVVRPPEAKGEKQYLVIKVLRIRDLSGRPIQAIQSLSRIPPEMGLTRVTMPLPAPIVNYGDRIQFRGVLQRPSDAENPGEFSLRRSLAREDIYTVAYLRDAAQLEVSSGSPPSQVVHMALLAKRRMERVFDQTMPPGPAGVLKALVFGDREGIPSQIAQDFKDAGVVHILSVSGLHLGFVAMLLLAACKILRLKPMMAALAAVAGAVVYAFLTGWQPPAVRAAIMWAAGVGARLTGRKIDGLAALVLAATGILAQNPLALFDVGFQLSFAATWGIVALAPCLLTLGPYRPHRLLNSPGPLNSSIAGKSLAGFSGFRNLWLQFVKVLQTSIAISVAAQFAALPLVAYYFNRLSLVAVLANLFLAPLSGIIVQVGLVAGAAGSIWLPLASLWQAANTVFIVIFAKLAAFFGRLPGSVLDVATPPVWFCVLYYAGLALVVRSLQQVAVPWQSQRLKQALLLVGIGLAAAALWWRAWEVASPELRVTFLNVGQGDAIHLRLPGGFQLLVDGGGRPGASGASGGYDVGENVVVPYLRRLGVRHLDMVLITHRHADHLKGLIKVAETIPAKELVEGERTPAAYANGQEDDSGYERLVTTALNRETHLRKVAAGDVFVFGKRSRLEILYPGQVDLLDSVDENDRSLVMRLSYRHFSLLLTGDLELRGRPGLPGSPDLQATILKVPHHGSKDALSAGFLAKVRPRVAVITVGRNSFGHPAPNTLALLKSKKVRVYRTDQNGAVIIQTDGHRYRVKSVHR